jgi:hypothetical protein
MKYINKIKDFKLNKKFNKTYEAKLPFKKPDLRAEFDKLKNIKSYSFNEKTLKKECQEYDVDFSNLIQEILLNRVISFQCWGCFDKDFNWRASDSHNVLGECMNVFFESDWVDEDSLITVKIKNLEYFHTPYNRKIKVYNYQTGPYMEELEMKKNAEKYNL